MVMDNLKNWYALDVDISNAINPAFNFENFLTQAQAQDSQPAYVWRFPEEKLTELFSLNWLEYMKSIDLEILSTLFFYRSPYYQHPTSHIDVPYTSTGQLSLALNWIVGPDNSHMVWHKLPNAKGDNLYTTADTRYEEWPMEDLEEIERYTIGNRCTLVRVDIPHNIIMSSLPRWSISARTKYRPGNWENSVARVKHLIVE